MQRFSLIARSRWLPTTGSMPAIIPLNHWLHDPEQGGGRIIGEGCHFIDFLTFLVGAPPVSVQRPGAARPGPLPARTMSS